VQCAPTLQQPSRDYSTTTAVPLQAEAALRFPCCHRAAHPQFHTPRHNTCSWWRLLEALEAPPPNAYQASAARNYCLRACCDVGRRELNPEARIFLLLITFVRLRPSLAGANYSCQSLQLTRASPPLKIIIALELHAKINSFKSISLGQ
jgi:hypothetical protein